MLMCCLSYCLSLVLEVYAHSLLLLSCIVAILMCILVLRWVRLSTVLWLLLGILLGLYRVYQVRHTWQQQRDSFVQQHANGIVCGQVVFIKRDQYPVQQYVIALGSRHIVSMHQPLHILVHQYRLTPVHLAEHLCLQVHPLKYRRHFQSPAATQGRLIANGEVGIYSVTAVLSHRPGVLTVIERLRVRIKNSLSWHAPAHVQAFLYSLVLGDRSLLDKADWAVFRRAGISHLIAISGLHVSLFVAFCWGLVSCVRFVYRQVYLYVPKPQLQAISGVVLSLLYHTMMPFGMPIDRAVLMILIWSCLSLFGIAWQALTVLLVCIVFFLLVNPFYLYSVSFVLSYFAVFWLLLYARSFMYSSSPLKSWLYGQVWMALGLIPISLWYFKQYPLMAVICNIIAIPWIALCILPLALIAVICSALSSGLGHIVSSVLVQQSARFLELMQWFGIHPIWAMRVTSFSPLILVLYYSVILMFVCNKRIGVQLQEQQSIKSSCDMLSVHLCAKKRPRDD